MPLHWKKNILRSVLTVFVLTLEVGIVRSTLPFQPREDVLKDKNEF